ncbi:hypothetical protein [Plebeiibacterium sediminum]|uniref:Outer membrane protein beta-barrel domain-containing protein n=1 Tax=Plebeiibacterium sediminum TaxID=2992112 RepID=A0AAE3M731_9BACT|nr:hypothetical protein [Plebeiobacterium sediminum]MCW3787780.1 hypothetical protein [Plebeiobacterium sediminum]
MQQYLKKALFASIILFTTVSSFGQYYKRNQFLEGLKIQPKVGFNMFYGDLVSEKRTKYTLGVAAEKELSSYINGRVDLSYGSMQGTQLLPGLNTAYATFDNTYIHFNVGATFRPLDLAYGLFKQRRVSPYIIGQMGVMQFSSTEYWGAGSGNPEGSVWREVSEMAPTFSMGGGVSIFYTSRLSINAEFIGSFSFNDRVDAHDVWYMADGTVVQTDSNDFFYVGTIGVSYLFSDSRWKNSPKYNRKAYLRTRSLYKVSNKKIKRPSRGRTKRYRR